MTQDQAELTATKEFLTAVITEVEKLGIYPRLNMHVDRAMLVLLLRCVRTAQGRLPGRIKAPRLASSRQEISFGRIVKLACRN